MASRASGQDLAVGINLGHYRIAEKIGAGGMGEVYRAHDEHLSRDVAIKVLPSGTLSDQSARRHFRNEALALSKLNHPGIATIYDFDTQDGVDFLVMEYIPGIMLSEKLAGRPLTEKEVIALGTQLAEALAAAHAEGVVHRDLKPGNLRLTGDGRLKILDFGLAKLGLPVIPGAATESLDQTLAMSGTLPYMAPEQLLGKEADARTDIHAAGAVLYEMATGQRPFGKLESAQLITAILQQAPAPPGQLNPRVPAELERLIGKCLEKEPENRYQSAKELAVDLRRLGTPSSVTASWRVVERPRSRLGRKVVLGLTGVLVVTALLLGLNAMNGWRERLLGKEAGAGIHSLAVLPLVNLSGDPEQEYFADGMTEELITDLSKIGSLKVISRTSVMQYKNARKPLPQIGRELGVEGVIEGSVQRVGDRVRISAQLIYAPGDTHLWAESYDRDLHDVLKLQGEVAQVIANEVNARVSPKEQARLADKRPIDPEAYQAYLQGRYYWNKRTEEDIRKAIGYFQQAVNKDPNYALAYAGLADSYLILSLYSSAPWRETYRQAKAAATKALEIDDTLAEAHATLASTRAGEDWDLEGALTELAQAIQLNPNYATGHQWYAEYLICSGDVDKAIAEIRRAQELDPLSLVINSTYGRILFQARRYDGALAQAQKTLEMDANFYPGHQLLAEVYEQRGMFEEAITEGQRAATLAGESAEEAGRRALLLRSAYARNGTKGYWEQRLQLAMEDARQSKDLPYELADSSPYPLAVLNARVGRNEAAVALLQKAFNEFDFGLYYLKTAPALDGLRSDPRVASLMLRIGVTQHR
jgi:TolB-like protein/protein involved in temperature-dependent protein secretion/predicted Ser/Thr protein kinase